MSNYELNFLKTIEFNHKVWNISIITQFSSILIQFYSKNSFYLYESILTLNELQTIFNNNLSIKEFFQIILSNLIDEKNFKIENNNNNIKLLFLTQNKIEIILENKIFSSNILQKIIENIELIKKENEEIKLELSYTKKEIKSLNEKIKFLEDKNKIIFETEKQNNPTINTNLEFKKTLNAHESGITSINFFPSGDLISVSYDKSIKFWSKNDFQLTNKIQNAHEKNINYVYIKDSNNFITCSADKNIKFWNKINNNWIKSDEIANAHKDSINKCIYYINDKIISCSKDRTIKLWQKENSLNYQCETIFTHSDYIKSILYLNDKNYLISSGGDGTKIWNLNNKENIISIPEAKCYGTNALIRLDYYRIIVGGDDIKIISLPQLKIIKSINNQSTCWGLCSIENEGIFISGGWMHDLRVYRYDNYECIQIIKNVHNGSIEGIIYYNNELILSYANDNIIKLWKIKKNLI